MLLQSEVSSEEDVDAPWDPDHATPFRPQIGRRASGNRAGRRRSNTAEVGREALASQHMEG